MTDLLCKLFIKNSSDMTDSASRERHGSLASIVGIIINVLLSAIKFVAGFLSASVAVMADAVNNLSDAGSSAVTFISFKLAAKPADRDHPFGHARIEYIASMIVSFIILKVGFDFLVDSVKNIFSSERAELTFSTVSIVILSVSVLLKLWLALFYRKIGKKINSSVVLASSADSLFDAISTLAVLVSAIVVKLTSFTVIDGIVGACVSLLILVAGLRILNETKNSLLGEGPVKDTVDAIENIVNDYPEILGIHDMLVHNYGPDHYIASFHAEVNGKDDLYMLHDVIDNVEKRISDELNIQCTIHLDPIVIDDEVINELRTLATSAAVAVDSSITLHDFRAVVGATHTNLIFDIVLPFESKLSPKEAKAAVSDEISKLRPDCYCVITVDRK